MKISKVAKAGTLESNDILIVAIPNPNGGVKLELESIVMKQFGDAIKSTILQKLQELEAEDIILKAEDRGALDYTIRSRVETAIKRAL